MLSWESNFVCSKIRLRTFEQTHTHTQRKLVCQNHSFVRVCVCVYLLPPRYRMIQGLPPPSTATAYRPRYYLFALSVIFVVVANANSKSGRFGAASDHSAKSGRGQLLTRPARFRPLALARWACFRTAVCVSRFETQRVHGDSRRKKLYLLESLNCEIRKNNSLLLTC